MSQLNKMNLAQLSKSYQKSGADPNGETISRKSNKSHKSRVVDNNIRGKTVDKITAEQRSPDTKTFDSIYRDDYKEYGMGNHHSHRKSDGNLHIVNLPNKNGQINGDQQHDPNFQTYEEADQDPYANMPDHTLSHFSRTIDGKNLKGIPYMSEDEAKYYDEMRTVVYKLKYKGPRGSCYKRDFVEHPLQKSANIKRDFYTTQNHGAGVEYYSTYGTDFKNWKMKKPKIETMDFRPATSGIPFGARSSYRQEFVNWGGNLTALDKPKQPKTVISDLPFIGKTTNRESFKPGMGERAEKVDNKLWGKSPLYPSIPFLGESVSMKTYKPFKVGPVNPNEHKPKDDPQPGKSFNAQYRTEYQDGFIKHPDQMNPREFLINKFTFY